MSDSFIESENVMKQGAINLKQQSDFFQMACIFLGFVISIAFPIFLAKVSPSKEGENIKTPLQIYI